METVKVPLSRCVDSVHQNRKDLGDIAGLARSIEVNGQITPIIVVPDGESYQIVAGHRRVAAMRRLGLAEADAYAMEGWDDARISRVLNAENNHRKELTEAERGRGIQTMLALGVPVADAAVSADVDEEKARSYVRGSKVVPVDAAGLDFDAVALMGEYDDVLTEEDVEAVIASASRWERESICRRARGRANAAALAEKLGSEGVKVVGRDEIDFETMRRCDGACGHAGMVAVVTADYFGEARAGYYCDDAEHACEPSPEEAAAEEAFYSRRAACEELEEHIAEFAVSIYPKFPGRGHSRLRKWAHEAFEARYETEPDDAWAGIPEPRGKALDQFVLMRAIPGCVPMPPARTLREGYEPQAYDIDDILAFTSFLEDVAIPAGYAPTKEERGILSHLHGILPGEGGEAEAEPAAA